MGGGGGSDPSPHISVQRSCFGTDIDHSKLGQQLHPMHDAVKTALPKVHQVTKIRTIYKALNKTPITKPLMLKRSSDC